jgi:hypothetical protein
VAQDLGETGGFPAAQPIAPGLRGLGPRQVALAPQAEQPGLRSSKAAVWPDAGKGTAHGVEQVQVG